MEETVSGKLEIRVIDRHLNNNDTYYDTKPIVCIDDNDEGLWTFVTVININKNIKIDV